MDKRSEAFLRPYSVEAEQRTDNLISAIATLRFEAYRAHASEHPALDKALFYLSVKLMTALGNENPHVLKPVRYEEPTPNAQQIIDEALAPLVRE